MKPPTVSASVASTRAAQAEATAATRKAKDAQQVHVAVVAKSGIASPEAAATKTLVDAAHTTAANAATIVQAAWDAAEGQKGAGLAALGDYLSVQQALGYLANAMQAAGISEDDTSSILQSLTTTITQAQAKAALRSENTPK